MLICQAQMCDALPVIDHAQIHTTCTNDDVVVNTGACRYQCNPGYYIEDDLNQDHKVMLCQQTEETKGQWSSEPPTCVDDQEPSIVCPEDQDIPTKQHLNYAEASWSDPIVVDNSEENITQLSISSNPETDHLEQKLFVLRSKNDYPYVVTYMASDSSGNVGTCTFKVRVEDTEQPFLQHCPDDIDSIGLVGVYADIEWNPPRYTDNSQGNVSLSPTQHSGQYPIGVHRVMYRATDEWGNENTDCQFEIKVTGGQCPFYEEPINGAMSCGGVGPTLFCSAMCSAAYDFAYTPATQYYCDNSGAWRTEPGGMALPWPDCSELYDPDKTRVGLEYQYYDGTCGDPDTNREIQENFMMLFRDLWYFDIFCPELNDTHHACEASDVVVHCGEVVDYSDRKKRSVTNETRVEFVITIQIANAMGFNNIQAAYQFITSDPAKLQALKDGMKAIIEEHKRVKQMRSIATLCETGAIMKEIKTHMSCVKCPVGTFWEETIGADSITQECTTCSEGYFQNITGQSSCNKCAEGSSTIGNQTKHFYGCKGFCKPGTVSKTGLQPCKACSIGNYQLDSSQSSCLSCPSGTTTPTSGASSITDCQLQCEPGFYSNTGVAPCQACETGLYQDEEGQRDCKECPFGQSTDGPGASTPDQCKDIDLCVNQPCQNGGQCDNFGVTYICSCPDDFTGDNCEEKTTACQKATCLYGGLCTEGENGYRCVCATGYEGTRCEINSDDCATNPCINAGTCVDKVNDVFCSCPNGYGGKFCEENINDCTVTSCFNEANCIDLVDDYKCICTSGFQGRNCSIPVEHCAEKPCQNGGICLENPGLTPSCTCPSGFEGSLCEIEVNECDSNPCNSAGTSDCIDKINSYHCICSPGYSGDNCDQVESSDFTLNFMDPLVDNFAKLNGVKSLKGLTVSFWLKIGEIDEGKLLKKTVVSYALSRQKQNSRGFQIMFDELHGLVLDINNKGDFTMAAFNDSDWHFFVVTWDSFNGQYKVYMDNTLMDEGTGLQTGQVIAGGGDLVLGQSQMIAGEAFDSKESFKGEIYRLNIKSYPLDQSHLEAERHNAIKSDVVDWADFRAGLHGNPSIGFLSACNGQSCSGQCYETPTGSECACPKGYTGSSCQTQIDFCNPNQCQNGGVCVNNQDSFECQCPAGFGDVRCGLSITCTLPSNPVNGQISHNCEVTKHLVPGQCEITVQCNNGFEPSSAATVSCQNSGKWSSSLAQCRDIDECSQSICSHECVNQYGGYQCSCPFGMQLNADMRTCEAVNECNDIPDMPNGGCSHQCTNTDGGRVCSCNQGYLLSSSGVGCTDINECETNNGGCEQICINAAGTFSCACRVGYTVSGTTCNPIQCPDITVASSSNMIVSINSHLIDGEAQFSCNPGHQLMGPSIRTCRAYGNWDGYMPSCQGEIFCGKGCFNGDTNNGISTQLHTDQNNSVDSCGAACRQDGYNYAGLQNGDECWCGHTFSDSNHLSLASCSTACPGNALISCGGPTMQNVYEISPVC